MPNTIKTEDVRPGDIVRVYQKISGSVEAKASKKEGERTQVFEGRVLARKHGSEPGATITVRREISGIGVEKIFPIHSPNIEKIEVVKSGKARRAKLYYLREATGQRAKIKER
ncbi:MAG: 50S ribosomal protein L19 [Candidatus Nealsonbacteria bacterium]|nr:50S ribosomal protein L19 [Candidatus Nealsonbacteria bacterium]